MVQARQQQQIQSLQQALQRLSEQQQQHPVPVPPAVAVAPVEDGQPGPGGGQRWVEIVKYLLVNKHLDPENHQLLMKTSLPTPIWQGLC